MPAQLNNASGLRNVQRVVFTTLFILILLQGLFNDLPSLRRGTYIDEILILILSIIFIKHLFSLDTESTKKDFSILLVFCAWLLGTYLIAVFNNSQGYLLTLSIYVKSLILLSGLIYVTKNRLYFSRIVEYSFIVNAIYGVMQTAVFYCTNIVLPGGGKKLLFYKGVYYLRAGGFCGHPNIFGMMLFPLAAHYFVTGKYFKLFIVSLAMIASVSRWPIFLAVLLTVLLLPLKRKLVYIVLICLGMCVFFYNFISKYNTIYEDYSSRSTIKLYSMKKAGEILLDNPFVGVGIGNFGTQYSMRSWVYQKYDFDNKMKSGLFEAKSGIESYLTVIFVENGIIFGCLYIFLIYRLFMGLSGKFVNKKKIAMFFSVFILSLLYYPLYMPQFLISYLFIIMHIDRKRMLNI